MTNDRTVKWDLRFLCLCKFLSSWSKDPSTKCASIIVYDMNKIVSIGYNGYPSGVEDDDSLNIREEKYQRIIHAEKNAILFAKKDLDTYNHTLYVYPLFPCSQCAAYIAQAGIRRVISVVPSDTERRIRWSDSNKIAEDIFNKKGIIHRVYDEADVETAFGNITLPMIKASGIDLVKMLLNVED